MRRGMHTPGAEDKTPPRPDPGPWRHITDASRSGAQRRTHLHHRNHRTTRGDRHADDPRAWHAKQRASPAEAPRSVRSPPEAPKADHQAHDQALDLAAADAKAPGHPEDQSQSDHPGHPGEASAAGARNDHSSRNSLSDAANRAARITQAASMRLSSIPPPPRRRRRNTLA